MTPAGGVTLEYADVAALLPHGNPMVLVDRVWISERGSSAVATKAVTGSEHCYHAAGRSGPTHAYAYPPALLVESFGQAAAVLWLHPRRRADVVPMFATAKDCSFAGIALPGAVLTHEVALDHASDGAAIVSGRTWAGDEPIATFGSLIAVVRERSEVDGSGDRDRQRTRNRS